MLLRPFHSVNWFQIQMTELHISFRRYPQECPLTFGIKKGTSSDYSSTDEKSTDYRLKKKTKKQVEFFFF